jgi:hypothetical protein
MYSGMSGSEGWAKTTLRRTLAEPQGPCNPQGFAIAEQASGHGLAQGFRAGDPADEDDQPQRVLADPCTALESRDLPWRMAPGATSTSQRKL